jgi:ubiquinone/menaquinone biosynthesis C-methylase UbiE
MNLALTLTIDSWLKEILVDPISKKPFIRQDQSGFEAACGISYKFEDGVPDFRVGLLNVSKGWIEGQKEYEDFLEKYLSQGETDPNFYKNEQQRDAPMYQELKLIGRVLDVGGGLGCIRKYMKPEQEFVSLDPSIGIQKKAENRTNLFAAYPISTPLNLLWGFAELLPFQDQSFDTINMRSCIDHFSNVELALLEAYRVLKSKGRLIIGMSVKDNSVKGQFKDFVKDVRGFLLPHFKDHHIWHPTYKELVDLCKLCGFTFEKEMWQADDIVYCSFVRTSNFLVK